jgi:hypothetical protein
VERVRKRRTQDGNQYAIRRFQPDLNLAYLAYEYDIFRGVSVPFLSEERSVDSIGDEVTHSHSETMLLRHSFILDLPVDSFGVV